MKILIRQLILICIFVIVSCSKDNEIITEEEILNTPETETFQVSDINIFSVLVGGKIINQGDSEILEAGVVISKSSDPTIENNLVKIALSINDDNEFTTFVVSLPEEITTYYVKAYAINSQGIGYGNEVQFQTLGNKTYSGSITLTNQDQVNEFGKNNYNTIRGKLRIEGSVSDLSPLKDLYIIGISFEVDNTTVLKNFKGLENLKRIGNNIANGATITNNHSLENFEGLDNLDIINGNFYILDNSKLINLSGLKEFISVDYGSLRIENCASLQSLEGLEKLGFIGLEFSISNNPILESLSMLKNLETVSGEIYIKFNNSLKNLDGLEYVKNINYLLLNSNPSLVDIDAIQNCETLDVIRMDGNINLTNFPTFNNLESISEIQIRYGSTIKNLSGLEKVKSIEDFKLFKAKIESLEGLSSVKIGTFEIIECQELYNLKGMENVEHIDTFFINYCNNFSSLEGFNLNTIGTFNLSATNVSSLKGLESLKYVEDNFTLGHNDNLENTNGLDNIVEIKDLFLSGNAKLNSINAFKNLKNLNNLFITSNHTLKNLNGFNNLEALNTLGINQSSIESLSGLNNLKNISDRFQVTQNPNLSDFCSLSEAFKNFTGNYEVYSNLLNPTEEDLKNNNCN